jgi:hypothetical protein
VAIFGLIMLVGAIEDSVDRWHIARGGGLRGTLIVEGTREVHYGKPPSGTALIGTFESDDGVVTRSVQLAEGWPDAVRVGDHLNVLWDDEDPERVFLADTRAFRNWVEGMIFLLAGLTVMGVVALVIHRRRRHYAAGKPASKHPIA